jgi:hypothetical protein
MDTTTVQPTETQGGLPGVEDKIVRELDVYLVQSQGELGHGAQASWRRRQRQLGCFLWMLQRRPCVMLALLSSVCLQTYLLQFPLRPPWRPYHSEEPGLLNVALKSKVCPPDLAPGLAWCASDGLLALQDAVMPA